MTSASAAITPRDAWRAARAPVALAGFLLLVVAVVTLLTGGAREGYLDPDATDRGGARALATLLRERGVAVTRSAAPSPFGERSVTTFLPVPQLLAPAELQRVGANLFMRHVVVVDPSAETLEALGVSAAVTVGQRTLVEARQPGCDLELARVAGDVDLGGRVFTVRGQRAAVSCYRSGGGASLVELRGSGGRVTLVGSGALFTNDRLARRGNAALALGLLSSRAGVQWVLPRPAELAVADDGDDGRGGLLGAVPQRVRVAFVQLLVAIVLLGLWQARRLGPVVHERLTVSVPAAETTEGRARLYRTARARGAAAGALRAGVCERIARPLGLARGTPADAVVAAVAERTGTAPGVVEGMLYGRVPADDAELVALADSLDRLDRRVHEL